MIKPKLKNNRGNVVLEVLICIGVITFFLFYPIATFSITHKENLLQDALTMGLQAASVEGGLTDGVEDYIYSQLEKRNLLPANSTEGIRKMVKINSNADARNNNTDKLIYRHDNPSEISLEILYPANTEVRLLNGLAKLVGAAHENVPFRVLNDDNITWYYRIEGVILSERIPAGM